MTNNKNFTDAMSDSINNASVSVAMFQTDIAPQVMQEIRESCDLCMVPDSNLRVLVLVEDQVGNQLVCRGTPFFVILGSNFELVYAYAGDVPRLIGSYDSPNELVTGFVSFLERHDIDDINHEVFAIPGKSLEETRFFIEIPDTTQSVEVRVVDDDLMKVLQAVNYSIKAEMRMQEPNVVMEEHRTVQ